MDKDSINVAVVGLGFGAEFVPIYLDHPNVKSIMICDSDPERLNAVSEKFNIKELYDLRELLFIEDEVLYKWYFNKQASSSIIPSTKISILLKDFKL